MNFTRVIETNKSFLDVYEINDNNELLLLCIDEIQDKLIVNPKIKFFSVI